MYYRGQGAGGAAGARNTKCRNFKGTGRTELGK